MEWILSQVIHRGILIKGENKGPRVELVGSSLVDKEGRLS